jgi:hypothetical protein
MTLVHTDNRGRVSLGKMLEPERDYRVTLGSHGVVVLEPITAVSDYEKAVLANGDLVAALERGREQAEAGRGRIVTRRRH